MSLSKENIEWKEYKLLQLIAAYPFSFVFGTYLEFLTKRISVSSKLIGLEKVPKNAILYGFHYDVMSNYMTMTSLSDLDSNHLVRWIGYHGFFSYMGYHCGIHKRYLNIRYQKSAAASSRDQIVSAMKSNPDCRFGIFTDYGDRGRVKNSLAYLSISSNRPLVPMRSIGDKTWKLLTGDQLPHLGTTVTSYFGEPIYPEQLLEKSTVEQTELLQRGINGLAQPLL